ncbi:MAG: gamma carbonic anhydrase family protein [Methylococcus sp.]|nr:gamma carbonic anhydrase family protein [Methylococcus sp.]
MALQVYNGIRPTLGQNVFVAESAFVAGDVSLGDDVSIWPMVVARGDVHRIEIGAATHIQDGSVLHVTQPSAFNAAGFPLTVGAGVTFGHPAVLHGCTIGDLCLIGIGAIVMDGAVIEDHVMVGAGTLVPPGKRLESGYLYVGSPAKQARPLKDTELEFLVHSRDGYVKLKNQYLRDRGVG